MVKAFLVAILFLAATFSTLHLAQKDGSVTDLRWGAGVEVAQARGK